MAYTNADDPRIWGGRLRNILDRWNQYPGSAPGGTGSTGLLSNDAQGWSDMLNEQTLALWKLNKDQEPLTVQEAPFEEGHISAQQPGSPYSTRFDTGQTSAVEGYQPTLFGPLAGLRRAAGRRR